MSKSWDCCTEKYSASKIQAERTFNSKKKASPSIVSCKCCQGKTRCTQSTLLFLLGMNRFHKDFILVEQPMNTYANTDKTSPSKVNASGTSAATAAVPPSSSTRRVPLTKAFSCSDTGRSTSLGHCAFISPKQFVELVSQDSNALDLSSVPILDCRSQMDFGCERIRTSHNINCRTKIVARKLASKRLEDVEPNLCSSLNNSDRVILYDQSSDVRANEKSQSSPINLVVQAAQKSNKIVHIIQGKPIEIAPMNAEMSHWPFSIARRRFRCCENRISTLDRMSSGSPARQQWSRYSQHSAIGGQREFRHDRNSSSHLCRYVFSSLLRSSCCRRHFRNEAFSSTHDNRINTSSVCH